MCRFPDVIGAGLSAISAAQDAAVIPNGVLQHFCCAAKAYGLRLYHRASGPMHALTDNFMSQGYFQEKRTKEASNFEAADVRTHNVFRFAAATLRDL